MRYTAFKLVQVTDCHVSADANAGYRGLNADRALASLLPAIRHWQPDLVLLTGDVAEDASLAAYGRVSAALGSLGAPVVALPGNHDDPAVMSRYFPMGPWNGPLFRSARGWQLVLLDSTTPGQVHGSVSPQQLDALRRNLARSRAEHLLLALHHQPVPVNSPWIDRYALRQPEGLLELLDNEPRLRCVTWGHIHHAWESARNGVPYLGSPSSVANSLPGREKFTPDVSGPACRRFTLYPNGHFETGLISLREAGPARG